MPKFLVEGLYEYEKQITRDEVIAATLEKAEELVTSVREKHGESVGDPWHHDRTVSVEEEITNLQKLLATSEKELNDRFVTLCGELNMVQCRDCNKWLNKDDATESDERKGIFYCEKCGQENTCRHCGNVYESGGDGFDGMCPICADKTDGNCHGCNKSLNHLDPSDIVEETVGDENVKFCSDKCHDTWEKKQPTEQEEETLA